MKRCKHCGEEFDIRGYSCRVCKNGLYRYNLTRIDMIQLHEQQDKKCVLCRVPIDLFQGNSTLSGNVDHCHYSNRVRGILCFECNKCLGQIESRIDHSDVLSYIERMKTYIMVP